MVRLFFAVRPPAEVISMIAAIPRPAEENVSWTLAERWIVKLRPLGHVPKELHHPLIEALEAELDGAPPVRVAFGPTTRRYHGQQLCAPVEGLDELAEAVFAATVPLVPVTHPQTFYPDLVLANGRIPPHLSDIELHAQWTVDCVLLVADRSSPSAPRLVDEATIALSG